MSSHRLPSLPCDLCDAVLDNRTAYDLHYRNVHGTTSLKPKQILRRIEDIRAAMPLLPGEKEPPRMTLEEAEAAIARFDQKIRERDAAKERGRRLAEDYQQASLQRQFKSGWMTARFPPGEVDGMLSVALDLSSVPKNYIFHKEGSWLQFASRKDINEILSFLQDYLRDEDTDEEEKTTVRKAIAILQNASPWKPGSHRGNS